MIKSRKMTTTAKNPSCKFSRYMPKDCTPKTCENTGQFCQKFFPDDLHECVAFQSAQPNLLVGAAKSIKDLQAACCTSGLSVDWVYESACNEPMASSCKWDASEKKAVPVNPSKSLQCVQKDRFAANANCTAHLSAKECDAKAECTWNHVDFALAQCKTTAPFEHSAGLAFIERAVGHVSQKPFDNGNHHPPP